MYNENMRRYFIGIGSNINPKENFPRILSGILQITPTLYVSRVIETQPHKFETESNFFNCAISFISEMNENTLKDRFNQIEIDLGRDRDAPNSKTTDRVADIDILFWINAIDDCAPADKLPLEPYLYPQTIELVIYLGLTCDLPLNTIPRGVSFDYQGTPYGTHVVTLER